MSKKATSVSKDGGGEAAGVGLRGQSGAESRGTVETKKIEGGGKEKRVEAMPMKPRKFDTSNFKLVLDNNVTKDESKEFR